MVRAEDVNILNELLRKSGADLTIRLDEGGGLWRVGDLEDAKQKLSRYQAKLSRQEVEMTDTATDAFWLATDALLAGDPSLHPSEARRRVAEQSPELAQLAQVPGGGRTRKNSKAPPANDSHYQKLFFGLSDAYEIAHGCSDQIARLSVAREHPDLRAAAFGTDPKTRFFSAAKFENRVNGLSLDLAYRRVAEHLPQDSLEVL